MRATVGLTLSAVLVLGGLFAAPAAIAAPPSAALTSSSDAPLTPLVRYAGETRFSSAVAISREYSSGVPVVYIVTGYNFPDALSAAPAATEQGGPMLLVEPTYIPEAVRTELTRLAPEKIVIVGGTQAVSSYVEKDLKAFAPTERISGADRYEVSRNVVEYAFGATGVDRLYVATGSNFPDALSASSAAGALDGAVLLVHGTASGLTAPTVSTISTLGVNNVVIAGGTTSVTAGIQADLNSLGLGGGVKRLGGADRYETGQKINAEAFDSTGRVYIATGLNFPDALAGAALAGTRGAPLFIVPGTCVTAGVAKDIRAYSPEQIAILGGLSAVSRGVETLNVCAPPAAPPVAKPVVTPVVKPVPKPPVAQPPVVTPPAAYYKNCTAVRNAGKSPLLAGQPGYETPRLDRDGDGVACE